jgi:hypothetical protein
VRSGAGESSAKRSIPHLHELSLPHDADLRRRLLGAEQVVGGHEHGYATLAQPEQEPRKLVRGGRVEPRHGLIEQEDV